MEPMAETECDGRNCGISPVIQFHKSPLLIQSYRLCFTARLDLFIINYYCLSDFVTFEY